MNEQYIFLILLLLKLGNRKVLAKYNKKIGFVQKMLEKLIVPVDRDSFAKSIGARKSTVQGESDLPAVEEEKAWEKPLK